VTAIEELRRNGHDVAQLPAARTAA
jgi:hypothetical protein